MFSVVGKAVLLTRVLVIPVKLTFLKKLMWEFHGGLVLRIPDFHCHGLGSMLGWGTKILQVAQHGQKYKKRETNVPVPPLPHPQQSIDKDI